MTQAYSLVLIGMAETFVKAYQPSYAWSAGQTIVVIVMGYFKIYSPTSGQRTFIFWPPRVGWDEFTYGLSVKCERERLE